MTFAQRMHSTLNNPSIPKNIEATATIGRHAKSESQANRQTLLEFRPRWTMVPAIGLSLFCFFAW